MRIDRKRLEQSLEELGRIGATERGGLTRPALSDEDKRGRDLLVRWMREAALRVTVDQMGNIFGERPGEPGRPPVMMGSHADEERDGPCRGPHYRNSQRNVRPTAALLATWAAIEGNRLPVRS